MEKILITGTGRSGTTFLVKLFTLLDFDTGFDKKDYLTYVFENCNAGLEKTMNDNHEVLKSPSFIKDIDSIIKDHKIKLVIIPVRNYTDSAKSRASRGFNNGGLWFAHTAEEQEAFYYKLIANYVYYMTKFDINTAFLDFDRMTTDKQYLYDRLNSIFVEKNISFETYSQAYEEASATSRPKS